RRRTHVHQLPVHGYHHRHRTRERHAQAPVRNADAADGVLRRQGRPGPGVRARRDGPTDRGRHAVLPPAPAHRAQQMVDVRLGVRARHRRLLAARHRGQQRAPVGGQRDPGDHAPVHRAELHLRGIRSVHRRARVDAGRGVIVPAEVDGPGNALGVPAGTGGRIGAGRQLGARAHRPGPPGLDSGRIGAVREDVPLAIPRLMPDQPRPSARIVAEPRWDVYYAVVLAACLAAMVPWYLFLGRPLMTQDQPATRKATVYLAGLVVLFAVAQSQVANAWVLAFGLVPMCFHVATARRAMVFVVIINVIAAGLDVWRNPGLAGALTALGIAAFAIAFAYVYSRWMARVIEQSLDRAALIEQL